MTGSVPDGRTRIRPRSPKRAVASAIAFATTYALGQAAKKYYASDRSLSPSQLKELFSSMLANGRSLQGNYAGEMAQRSRQMNVSDLLALTKQT